MPLRWKIFKVVAIIQLIFATFKTFLAFAGLFVGGVPFLSLLEIVTYGLMVAFVTLGFSVVNYNFPDTPLSTSRKRWFNYLFLLNFLLIAVLFAKAISEWGLLHLYFDGEFVGSVVSKIYYYFLTIHNTVIFLIHFYLLYSMYRLRKEIYSNSEGTWIDEFNRDETKA